MPHRKCGQFQAMPRMPVHGSCVCGEVGVGGVPPGAQGMLSSISQTQWRRSPLLAAESQREPEESLCSRLLDGEVGLLFSLWLGKE